MSVSGKALLAGLVLGLAAQRVIAGEAKDLSAITLNLSDNASLIVTDAQGHLAGVDPTIPKMYQDIPDASVGDVPFTHAVSLFHPPEGTYQVIVIGTAFGSYKLEMATYSKDGAPQPKIILQGDTAPGVKTIYDLAFKPDWFSGSDPSTLTPRP